jgi:hypothetical protein
MEVPEMYVLVAGDEILAETDREDIAQGWVGMVTDTMGSIVALPDSEWLDIYRTETVDDYIRRVFQPFAIVEMEA